MSRTINNKQDLEVNPENVLSSFSTEEFLQVERLYNHTQILFSLIHGPHYGPFVSSFWESSVLATVICKNTKYFGRFQSKSPDRDTHICTHFIWGYKVPSLSFTLQKKLSLYRFSFFRYKGFTLTYDFHSNRSIFA